MAIISHPTKRFYDKHGDLACLVVQCDFCHRMAERVGDDDAGLAAEGARKEGFQTVKNPTPGGSRLWWCSKCEGRTPRTP